MSRDNLDCPRRPGRFGRIFLSHDCRPRIDWCRRELRDGWFAAFVVLSICLFALSVLLACRQVDHHFSKESCAVYGEQTGRQVKWVDESFVYYHCYVRWNDTWIPRGDYTRITFGHETGVENG